MNISYTGKMERFYPAQTEKVDARFAKLAKLLDGKKGERSAHVILTKKRSFHHAEITVNYMDHSLVGEAQDNDQFLAVTAALDKLEKQVRKYKEKVQDHRRNLPTGDLAGPTNVDEAADQKILDMMVRRFSTASGE